MRSALFSFCFICVFLCLQSDASGQTRHLQTRLDSLQKADKLSDWIYERLEYAKSDPQQHLSFLLQTQQQLWRKATDQTEHFAFLDLLNVQGYHQLLVGNILGSINSYETSFAYYLKNQVAGYEIVDYTLKPLSNNYTRLGDYERALYLQRRALNFQINNDYPPADIASMYGNMAICFQSMGNLAEAEKTVNQGLKLVRPGTSTSIVLTNVQTNILFDNKQYERAAKLIEANIRAQRQTDATNAYRLMNSFSSAGNIYTALKQYAKADLYFAKAIQLLDQYYPNKWIRERANLITQRGHLKLLQQKPALALAYFNQTLSLLQIKDGQGKLIVRKVYGDNRVMEVFEQMAKAYQQLKQPDLAIQHLKLSLLAGDQIRNEFAGDETKQRLQADLKHLAERGIAISFERYQQNKNKELLNDILAFAEQSKSRTLLDQIRRNQQLMALNQKDSLLIRKRNFEMAIAYHEKQELEGEKPLAQNVAELRYNLAMIDKQLQQKYQQSGSANQLPAVKDILTKLPSKRFVEYFVGEDAIYLIDIDRKQVQNVVRLADAKQIKSDVQTFVATYFQQGPNAMLNSPKDFFQASYQVYSKLLKGIRLKKNEALTIIPDGILGYISFDGLVTHHRFSPNFSSWPFLIKHQTISYSFSIQTLVANLHRKKQKGFTGFFITHQQGNNVPLKAVQAEAAGIKKSVNGQFLFNEQVSAKVFQQEFGRNEVLHIGTHAYLSGKNQEPTLDLGKEKLFLFELAAQRQAPSLVVLSACRTADGLLANGEGVISLSRGFNAIGTSATIAGLWNVNDLAASVITGNFYRHLSKSESGGQALHRAKLDWLAMPQNSDAYYLPYYWDSLIYMGTDEQTDLARPFNWIWIAGIGVLAMGLLVGWVWLRKRLKPKGL